MLPIYIPEQRLWDEANELFVNFPEQTLNLEHSLISVYKWEAKYHKPFLDKEDKKTLEETIDYIKFMDTSKHTDPNTFMCLTEQDIDKINKYIEDPMTADKFYDTKSSSSSSEKITATTIYYWMFSLQIPKECERWHLNRLIALIRFFNAKNAPKKKMSQAEIMRRNAELNAARCKAWHTTG